MPILREERLLDFFSGLSFAGKPTRMMVKKMEVSMGVVSLLFKCSSQLTRTISDQTMTYLKGTILVKKD